MPNDPNQNPEPGQAPQTDGETPPAVAFAAWLDAQPDEVKQAFEGHVAGLKSALHKERDAREALEKAGAAHDGELATQAEAAEQRAATAEAKLAELAGLPAQVTRYKTALQAHVQQARATVPEHVQTLLDRLDPVEQLEYLSANAGQFPPLNPGGPTNAPARGSQANDLNAEEKRQRAWRLPSL